MKRFQGIVLALALGMMVGTAGCGDGGGGDNNDPPDDHPLNLTEQQVNTTSIHNCWNGPANNVAMGPRGQFLSTFHTGDANCAQVTTLGQFFASNGSKLGNEAQIDLRPFSNPFTAVAFEPDGGAFALWTNDQEALIGRRYDAGGSPVGTPLQIVPLAAYPQIAIGSGGQIVAVYAGACAANHVCAQRIDQNGASRGSEIDAVPDGIPETQDVAVFPSGGFVVSNGHSAARIFTADGARVGAEIRTEGFARIAGSSRDEFALVWFEGFGGRGGRLQKYSSTGEKRGPEVEVTSYSFAGDLFDAALRPDGSVVVVWVQDTATGNFLVGQRFAADGSKLGAELQLSNPQAATVYWPRIAAGRESRFVVSWYQEDIANNGVSSIRARLFED